MYVNSVTVVGNLTADPTLGGTENRVVNFRMGVNRFKKNDQSSDDQLKERTEFLDVECWGPQADYIQTSLKKGDRVLVAGQLKYDQWSDDEGNLRSRMRIRASAVGPSLEFRPIKTY
jgi:single-strand DNA-binding protein